MSSFLKRLPADFEPVDFDRLPGLSTDRLSECWSAFLSSCARLVNDAGVLRNAAASPDGTFAAAERALQAATASEADIREYFSVNFSAYWARPHAGSNPHAHGFVTGYYEPEAPASRVRAPGFEEPARGRPSDLVQASVRKGSVIYSGARVDADGMQRPYWSRAEIDAGKSEAPPVLWLRDAIELFMIQVQGSARVTLPDGKPARLVYDGRNGHPYESIGRILVNEGHIPLAEMSLDTLKNWVRKAGQAPGERGRALLHRNPSYIFFRLVEDMNPSLGPVGGEGVHLTPLRSLAVDRTIWPYGLPFWLNGQLPSEEGPIRSFQRLMVAQDTGSAIVGAGRGDIFFGSGDAAGQAAARVRHAVDVYVLLPRS
jgi:membrane-bound lytic murein transglycosylase A